MVLALAAITTSLPTHKRAKRSQPSTDRLQPHEQVHVELYRARIADLYQRAADIHSETIDAINSMDLPQATMEYLNETMFIEVPEVSGDRINELRREPVATLTSHRALISEMYFHIRRCHTVGQIGQQSLAKTSITLRSWLVRISSELSSMKTVLSPPSFPQSLFGFEGMVHFSESFLNLETNNNLEDYRAYIILKDTQILMGYLKVLYATVLQIEYP